MKLKGIIFEDFVNYKKPCITLEFPTCSFKCDKEAGVTICHNNNLANAEDIECSINDICIQYLQNKITEAVCLQGLEPLDDFNSVFKLTMYLRDKFRCEDDIVIYTGYKEDEVKKEIDYLSRYKNIIVKFGRYIPNRPSVYDDVLGVFLSSDNQYAKLISKKEIYG